MAVTNNKNGVLKTHLDKIHEIFDMVIDEYYYYIMTNEIH